MVRPTSRVNLADVVRVDLTRIDSTSLKSTLITSIGSTLITLISDLQLRARLESSCAETVCRAKGSSVAAALLPMAPEKPARQLGDSPNISRRLHR